jgi:CDP-diacylglycerol--glycerol-3-phosphate 3-phosphatidyltransferase
MGALRGGGLARPVLPVSTRSLSLNLPNALTAARIFLVPLLVVVLLTKFEGRLIFGVAKELVGAAIFAVASLTDWLDGYLARRRKQVTTLGQLMDPLADKLLITAALVSLVQMGLAPAWMVAVILGRELAVTLLRSLAHARGVAMPASSLGKIKMIAQVVAILLLILGRGHVAGFVVVGQVSLWVALVAAVWSATDYYRRFTRALAFAVAAPPPTAATPTVASPPVVVAPAAGRRRALP